MGQLDVIATTIYNTEFPDDSVNSGCANTPTSTCNPNYVTQKISEISAWLETNIGQLNVLINSDFRVDSNNNVCPVLKPEEIAIFIQLYLKAYYKRQSRSSLTSATSSSSSTTGDLTLLTSDWTELREGDSVIKRTAQIASPQEKIKVAQAFSSYSDEADIKLVELVHSYNMYRSSPRQVAGKDIKLEDTSDCCTASSCTPTITATPFTVTQTMTPSIYTTE